MPKERKDDAGDARKVREEVHQATRMDGMMEKLAQSLQNGQPIKATSSAQKTNPSAGGSVVEPEPEHLDPSVLAQSLSGIDSSTRASGDRLYVDNPYKKTASVNAQQTSASAPADYGDLNGVIYGILTFPFSSDPDARQKEISRLQTAITKQQSMVKVSRIVGLTKKTVQGAKDFFVGEDGSVRMEFSILSHKYSMKVQGPFLGNETLYPTVEGDEVIGLVMRNENGKTVNASKEFKISITKGWKEPK